MPGGLVIAALALLGCSPDVERDATVAGVYRGYPVLEAVSGTCTEAGLFDIRGRTRGWTESGVVQIWEVTQTLSDTPYATYPIASNSDFARDETCDTVAIDWDRVDDDALPARCLAPFDTTYVALIRITFEKGCAGEQWLGAGPDAAAEDTGSPGADPALEATSFDEDCPSPYDDDAPALDAEIVDTFADCPETAH